MKYALILLLVACGEVAPQSPDGAFGADAPIDAAPPIDAPDVPLVSEALAADCGAYVPASGVGAGNDLHKVTLDDPAAICNDGTPAVMYIRPSTGGANASRWVFYLQGGGSCGTAEQCAIRYCGIEKYTKAKMSSRWTPMSANTDGQGLLDRDGSNPFADANLVLMYYCSSDQWMGQKDDSVLVPSAGPTPTFRLHFRGHSIIEAALDQLLAGDTVSDDGQATVPSLAGATAVLWSGTSAGGNGAEQNLDYVAGRLAPNGTAVRGVFDANMPPQVEDLGDPAATAAFTAYDRDTYWPSVIVGAWNGFADASCLAGHAPSEQWECGQNEHVVLNHITTPFFVRQDLRDRQVGTRYLNAGATEAQLATAYRTTISRLIDVPQDAEERAAITFVPGVYAPNCGQHVGLSSDEWWETATLSGLTYRQAVGSWLNGNAVNLIDTHPTSLSTCRPPVDNGE